MSDKEEGDQKEPHFSFRHGEEGADEYKAQEEGE